MTEDSLIKAYKSSNKYIQSLKYMSFWFKLVSLTFHSKGKKRVQQNLSQVCQTCDFSLSHWGKHRGKSKDKMNLNVAMQQKDDKW